MVLATILTQIMSKTTSMLPGVREVLALFEANFVTVTTEKSRQRSLKDSNTSCGFIFRIQSGPFK